jgi:putative intracellular protease/amidase
MAKGKVLIIGSSADTIELKSGKKDATGYYLNELAVPARALVDAGYDIALATPKGMRPIVDDYSVRVDYFDGSAAALQEALDFVASNLGLQNPKSIRSVIDDGLDQFVAIFVPGGHPPMVDLMEDPDLGEVLRYFHDEGKLTALLCHGPVAMTAAMPKAREFKQACVRGDAAAAKAAAADWPYAGYSMTVFSDEEEKWAEEHILRGERVQFYPAYALATAGGKVQNKGLFKPNVVQDRELITGQNPFSDGPFAELFLKTLARSTTERREAPKSDDARDAGLSL